MTAAAQSAPATPWRDNIEAMAMAVVMALLLKYFIIEAYKIPSGSMQPTLIGDESSETYDRILVDKLSYLVRDPKRWEVVVFRFPLDRSKHFVKRVAGVGPEELRIRHGDIWRRGGFADPWRIARRPKSVLEEVLKPLDPDEPEEPSWVLLDGSPVEEQERWRFEGRTIEARGDGLAAFHHGLNVRDEFLDGYPAPLDELIQPTASAGTNLVGDLRVDGSVNALPGTTAVTMELTEGNRRYRFTIPGPAADPERRPVINEVLRGTDDPIVPPLAVAEQPYRLPANLPVRVGAQNIDDLLELEVDGETVASFPIDFALSQEASAYVGVEGEGADFDDLMVYRDVYYTNDNAKESEYVIPAGHYFVLGDNTLDSADSREWSFKRYLLPEGEDDVRLLRGSERRGENPMIVGHGEDDGPKVRFVDEWGEIHWFRRGDARQQAPEHAPFVPRDMIQGRALAVFWPVKPWKELYRWKWIH